MLMRLSLLLAAVLIFAACSPNAAPPPTPTDLPAIAQVIPTTSGNPDDVLATVNGQPISRAAFNRVMARRQQELEASDVAALEAFVLTTLINQALTEQEAARMGVTVSEQELNAEIDTLKGLIEGSAGNWQTWLAENNYTEAEFTEELRAQLLAIRVRDLVVADAVNQSTRQVHARHILVDTEQEALALREQLVGGGDFVALAAQFSKDVTTREEGGDLGWFTQEELLEPRVAEVAFGQAAGEISMPVPTRLGYHLIETLAFDDLPLPPEKQAQVAQVVFDEWLITLNDSAIIEIYR